MNETSPPDPLVALRKRTRILDRLMDEQGRIKRWPVRRAQQLLVLEHIAVQLPDEGVMDELELGRVLEDLHSFRDPARVRRELVELGLLQRKRDGSAYWKPQEIE